MSDDAERDVLAARGKVTSGDRGSKAPSIGWLASETYAIVKRIEKRVEWLEEASAPKLTVGETLTAAEARLNKGRVEFLDAELAAVRRQRDDLIAQRDEWRKTANDAVAQAVAERDAWAQQEDPESLMEPLKERIEELESINEGHVVDKDTYRIEIQALRTEIERLKGDKEALDRLSAHVTRERDELIRQNEELMETICTPAPLPIQNEPYLGLATTEEMFRELISLIREAHDKGIGGS